MGLPTPTAGPTVSLHRQGAQNVDGRLSCEYFEVFGYYVAYPYVNNGESPPGFWSGCFLMWVTGTQ